MSYRAIFRLFIICTLMSVPGVGNAYSKSSSPEFGAWQFSSFKAPSGNFYCSILSAVENKDVGQNIVIKGSPQRENVVIDLYKDKWNRRQGSTINVMFDFVNNQPLTLPAYADSHILDIELPTQVTGSFLLEVAQQPVMQVIFPDSDEGTWIVSGNGAESAVKKMVNCLRNGE